MRKDRIRAYQLRRKNKSYSQISQALNIPKSTLASWFRNEEWSIEIRDRLGKEQSLSYPKKLASIIKINKQRWEKWRQDYRDEAEKEFVALKNNPLFIAGTMLYWGEGNKSSRANFKLSNSDPSMVRVFYNFLKNTLKIPQNKICVYLLLYPDLKDDMQKAFWSKSTGIPIGQFRKSVFIKGKHPSRRLSYGVCNIYVNSRGLTEKIITWINLYQKEFA